MNLFKLFRRTPKTEQIDYKLDLTPWEPDHAETLHGFFKTPTGSLFLQHLKSYEIAVNEWACNVTDDKYNTQRACLAKSLKLAHDNILQMAVAAKQAKPKEVSKGALDKFFASRMGLFKV